MHKRIHILSFILMTAVCRLSMMAETYPEKLLKLRKSETKIDFYGIFLDQNDCPVPDVKVHYTVSGYSLTGLAPRNARGMTTSDGEGLFEIHAHKGGILYIDDVECIGYEFRRGNHPRSFEFRSNRTDRHRPDKANPVVFRLRKKHTEAVVLLSSESRIRINGGAGEEWLGLDLSSGDTVEPRFKGNPQYFHDLEFTWEHNAEKKEYSVNIVSNGEQAGVLVSDKLLYEALADGYAKEVSLTFKYSDKPSLKHLYLRLRDCGMYARMDVEHGSVSENGIYFYCKTVINPYGSRSLEDLVYVSSDESGELLLKCFKEARKAMKEQRFAPRPPFEQWIKDGKMKY